MVSESPALMTEVIRFKASAAQAASQKINLLIRGVFDNETGLVQAVADNFDATISSPNGLRSTHSLALLLTQVRTDDSLSSAGNEKIRRIKKEEMKNEVSPAIPIQRYTGPRKAPMPVQEATHRVPSLKMLASQQISLARARAVDYDFLQKVIREKDVPENNGFNTRASREQGQSIHPATKAIYTPLIDMVPSQPDTIMTAMNEAQKLTLSTGQAFMLFTID